MAMTRDDLLRLREDARRTMDLKAKAALEGHDFVVASHTLTSWELAELVHYALLGERVRREWHQQQQTHKPPSVDVIMSVTFLAPVSGDHGKT